MDHQSSIRSFFQPLSSQNAQQKQPPPNNTTTSPYTSPPPPTKHRLPPPPVKSPSSYALPPSQIRSQNQTPPKPPPTLSNPANPPSAFPLLPPSAGITPISPEQIPALRRINALLLPISYPDKFYAAITTSRSLFSRVITWDGKVVGGVVCRVDCALDSYTSDGQFVGEDGEGQGGSDEGGSDEREIYIQSLTLLSPYRNMGLATLALESIIQTAITTTSIDANISNPNTNLTESSATENIKIKALYAHVWTQNTDALEWYAKKGFTKYGAEIQGYYRRLKPDGAWILRRELRPSDHLKSIASTTIASPKVVPSQIKRAPSADVEIEQRDQNTIVGNEAERDVQNQPRPNLPTHTRSFQNQGPEREWNDLPVDISNGLLKPVTGGGSGPGTGASSRSSSRSGGGGKKKKERVYPKAAFGA